MNKYFLMLSTAVLPLYFLLSMSQLQAKTLLIASDEWCPYVCDDDVLPGFLVEVLNEIADKNKLDTTFSFIPLARALSLSQKSEVDIVLALTQQHISNYKLQQSKQSFGGLYNDFYVLSDNNWRYKNTKDLSEELSKNNILGTINGYQYGDEISQLIYRNQDNIFAASGNSPLEKQLKMLHIGRLDILLDSRFTVQYQLSKSSYTNIIHAGTHGDFVPLYLGYSSSMTDELIETFDRGILSLRSSGRLAEILAKYSISDWQQPKLALSNNTQLKNKG